MSKVKKQQKKNQYASVLVCQGCQNKIPKFGLLKQQNSVFSSSGDQKFKIKVSAFLLRTMRKNLFQAPTLASCCFLAIFVSPWLAEPRFSPSSSHGIFLVCMSVSRFPFVQGHRAFWIRTQPNDPILTEQPLHVTYLQRRSHSEVLGVRISIYKFWEDTLQLVTLNSKEASMTASIILLLHKKIFLLPMFIQSAF